MPQAPSSIMSLVCKPSICVVGTQPAPECSPAKPAPFPMECPLQHHQDGGGRWALDFFGSRPLLLPMGRIQLIAPSHFSSQQHFDGRAQDSRESPSSQTILHLGPLSLLTPSQYLLLPPDIHYLLFP